MQNTPPEQLLMGTTITLLCLLGVVYSRWFLNNTRKGRWLLIRFGPRRGLLILRTLFLVGMICGLSLAFNLIRPMFAN